MLSQDKYIRAIELTQVVSIDLIISKNQLQSQESQESQESREILVGKRINNPAKNTWFVPGGRVYKNETLQMAIKRLSNMELGYEINYEETCMLGAYDHIYSNNFRNFKDENGNMIPTHYVVIALMCSIDVNKLNLEQFEKQHAACKWMNMEELKNNKDVHQYTKNYIIDIEKKNENN